VKNFLSDHKGVGFLGAEVSYKLSMDTEEFALAVSINKNN